MPQDSTLPPELQAEIKQVEAEASELERALVAAQTTVDESRGFGVLPTMNGCAPLPYVRELLAMLKDAWVADYQDGPLRIHRDIDGLRAHVQATQAPPERVW